MKKTFFLFCMVIAFCAHAQTVVTNVDAKTFKKYIVENKSVLIDLRTDEEILEKGKIKGAIQIDYRNKNSATEIAKLDKKKTYLVYCASGRRSSQCAGLMEKEGFARVVNLENGFDDWKQKGYEIELK